MILERIKASAQIVRKFLKSDLFAFILRFAFAAIFVFSSVLFLETRFSRGQTRWDAVISVTMIMMLFALVDWISNRIIKGLLAAFLGAFLIFFHLAYGLYYRFFSCPMPFDVYRHFGDIPEVGGYGMGLLSLKDTIIAIILPLILLTGIVLRPFKNKARLPLIIIVLFVIITTGWIYRINRPLFRSVRDLAVLPDYIHRLVYWHCTFGIQRNKYTTIVNNINDYIPRHLAGYKIVKGKGIMLEPVDSIQKETPKKYNIILILMESVRAYECGFLGANPSYTPALDELAKNARIFTDFYANGSQTVRAEISCLCSVYCNPIGTPTYLVNPTVKLISLPQILIDNGYQTLWFSAFTASFHNKRTFLSRHGIQKIYDRDTLPKPKQPEIAWGMNDCEFFDNVWDIIKDANEPFFAQLTTLSNHVANSIYPVMPKTKPESGTKEYTRYVNGTYYTDFAVAGFVTKVLNSKLAANTVVIITGDHGLWIFPEDIAKDPVRKVETYFRVPMCIWGPPEVIQPGYDQTLGSHVDISPSLLDIMNIKAANTFLGQSLFDSDVKPEDRYVAMFLGTIPMLRKGNEFLMPEMGKKIKKTYVKAERMNAYSKKDQTYFYSVDGDILRGNYTTAAIPDDGERQHLSNLLNDIVFLTVYGIYFDAYMGIR